jgi:hypothetical protein
MASKKDLKKAQQGVNIPPMATSPITPQLDFGSFDAQFGGYTPPPNMFSNLQGRSPYTPSSPMMAPRKGGLNDLIQETSKPGNKGAGSRITTQDDSNQLLWVWTTKILLHSIKVLAVKLLMVLPKELYLQLIHFYKVPWD